MGSHRVGHDWRDLAAAAAALIILILLCSHYQCLSKTVTSLQTETLYPLSNNLFPLSPALVTSNLLSISMNLPIPDIPLNGITQNLSRWFIQVVACVRTSFRFMGEQYSSCVDIPHFVHPFICWWALGWFPALATVISAAMNTGVQVSVFNPFRYIHRCEIAECYSNAMLSFLRNCQTFSQWLHHFTLSPAMGKSSSFPTSSSISGRALWGSLLQQGGAKTNKFPGLLTPKGMVSLFLNGVKVGVCPGVR